MYLSAAVWCRPTALLYAVVATGFVLAVAVCASRRVSNIKLKGSVAQTAAMILGRTILEGIDGRAQIRRRQAGDDSSDEAEDQDEVDDDVNPILPAHVQAPNLAAAATADSDDTPALVLTRAERAEARRTLLTLHLLASPAVHAIYRETAKRIWSCVYVQLSLEP